ncbi:hypothetical protein KIN20_027051 [Parelaphostrongylus tenuis]|uniref:Uncharacterized protein n=1 Tax=Parelaphostrongylus tenuis TaxID=148309 RepID=A0AAD5QZ46_PARTN|nr:hypothetical protein KIN20_027051 [Parelaphostrongylus tenuis]
MAKPPIVEEKLLKFITKLQYCEHKRSACMSIALRVRQKITVVTKSSEANLATHEEDWKKEFYERSLVLFWLYKQVNFSVTNLAFDSQTGYRGAIE